MCRSCWYRNTTRRKLVSRRLSVATSTCGKHSQRRRQGHTRQVQQLCHPVDEGGIKIKCRIPVAGHQTRQPTREKIAGTHLLVQQKQTDQVHRTVVCLGKSFAEQRPECRQRQQRQQPPQNPARDSPGLGWPHHLPAPEGIALNIPLLHFMSVAYHEGTSLSQTRCENEPWRLMALGGLQ